jgi:hypothetical protein
LRTERKKEKEKATAENESFENNSNNNKGSVHLPHLLSQGLPALSVYSHLFVASLLLDLAIVVIHCIARLYHPPIHIYLHIGVIMYQKLDKNKWCARRFLNIKEHFYEYKP